MQQVRLEGARRGGRHRAKAERLKKLMPSDMREVFDILRAALSEVHSGVITPSQAGGMAALAGAMVKLAEAGELAERVARLEELVDGGMEGQRTCVKS
jgi:hypothetical protein